jgi:hypothetical protein
MITVAFVTAALLVNLVVRASLMLAADGHDELWWARVDRYGESLRSFSEMWFGSSPDPMRAYAQRRARFALVAWVVWLGLFIPVLLGAEALGGLYAPLGVAAQGLTGVGLAWCFGIADRLFARRPLPAAVVLAGSLAVLVALVVLAVVRPS